jgi:putative oxidoreductase
LIIVLLMALFTVHLDNGWLVIGSSGHDPEIAKRVTMAREILREYGNYDWLTAKGSFVILQNGMENVVTYIAMLLMLIVHGPGRISIDALIEKKFMK